MGLTGRSVREVRRPRPEVAPAVVVGPRQRVPGTTGELAVVNEPEVVVAAPENECPGLRTTGTRACGSTRARKRPTATIVIVRTSEEEDQHDDDGDERAEEEDDEEEDNESTVRKSKL